MAPSWLELCVAVDHEAAEPVSDLLARYGYNGGVAFEMAWEPEQEGDVGVASLLTTPPCPCHGDTTHPVVLRTYIPLDEHAEEVRQQLEQALWHLGQLRPVGKLHARMLDEQDWANAWKEHYRVQHIGERTVIVPSWLDYAPQPDEVVLHLDPGMAFGTGLHPTTQLCLRLLEPHVSRGVRMLDLGCGSGILSIAGASLGAASVLALDTDPQSVLVARENIARNNVHQSVQVEEGTLGQPQGAHLPVLAALAPFGLVVANIIADVLIDLAHPLAAALAPEGALISSGIILSREDEVALAFAAAGLRLRQRQQHEDWVALVHTHQHHAPV